jgi:hypothetical protein
MTPTGQGSWRSRDTTGVRHRVCLARVWETHTHTHMHTHAHPCSHTLSFARAPCLDGAEGHLPEFRYHVAPLGLKPGSKIMSGDGAPVHPGCVLRLRDIPLGTPIHNLELQPGKGGKLVRSAHTSAVISVKQEHNAIVKLPSGAHMFSESRGAEQPVKLGYLWVRACAGGGREEV